MLFLENNNNLTQLPSLFSGRVYTIFNNLKIPPNLSSDDSVLRRCNNAERKLYLCAEGKPNKSNNGQKN